MTKLSFTWSVGSPVIWMAYDNKRCIVQSSPGIWDGTDFIWFIAEHDRLDFAFAVNEASFRAMTTEDLAKN